MIERIQGTLTISCDFCPECHEMDDDWNEAVREWKAQGWKMYKNGEDEWEHKCPDCFEKWKRL